jgi:hypothetical protein
MSFCPVALYVGIQAAALFLHCRPLLFALHQIRTEQIQFVIQGDEVIHKFVLHLAIQWFFPSLHFFGLPQNDWRTTVAG